MTDQIPTPKQDDNDSTTCRIADQLEHAFLPGLGALSTAQKLGSKTFDSLVEQGEAFRDRTTDSTEELIEQVQDAIRGMADEATAECDRPDRYPASRCLPRLGPCAPLFSHPSVSGVFAGMR